MPGWHVVRLPAPAAPAGAGTPPDLGEAGL